MQYMQQAGLHEIADEISTICVTFDSKIYKALEPSMDFQNTQN